MLSPDHYYRSVETIDFGELSRRGVDTLLVDLDNTLLRRNATEVPDSVKLWAASVQEKGFKICIVSNNWHDHVVGIADEIGLELVAKAVKPLPFAFSKALRRLGSSPGTTAVVGDQMFTDVLGGKLMGMVTVLVVPLSSSDLPHTVVLRALERLLLAGRAPLP